MSRSAQNSAAGRRRLAAQHQVERGSLERVLLVGVVDEPQRDAGQLDQRGGAAGWRETGARRSESEDHLVFVGLEYGIADSQARRRDQRGRGHQADPRPMSRVQHVVKQFDEVERRIETKPPLHAFVKLRDRKEDRRREIPRLQQHRNQVAAVAIKRVRRGHDQAEAE